MKRTIMFSVIFIFLLTLAQAVSISSVEVSPISPGGETAVRIELENNLDRDVKDVSLALKFGELPFIPIGSSESSLEEIQEGDEEQLSFLLKASPDIIPGNYEIPLQLIYNYDGQVVTRSSSIGVQVIADPELSFALSTENAVVGSTGQVSLKIINRGFYDARFVSVKILAEDFTLTSDDTVYIGTIDSDDFETANFDVIFRETNSEFRAIVEYRDFDNKKIISQVELPLGVYTMDRAVELGIISQNNTSVYVIVAIVILVIFFVWRSLRKRQRLRRSQSNK